jgi:hypothetical protein
MSLFFENQANKDAAQRIADAVALHLLAADDLMDAVGQWCVFRLTDGSSPDGHTLYECKDDAVRMMRGHAKDFCYLRITPDGIRPNDAWHFLRTNRHPFIDTTAPEHVINPVLMPHMSNLTRRQRRAIDAQVRSQQSDR